MDIRMYVMTDKEYKESGNKCYRTLHVGRALGDDLGYQGDDTGDNISSKNRDYGELTGLYWVWKNVTCDIVGICSYRRYFCVDRLLFNEDYIEEILDTCDIVAPYGTLDESAGDGLTVEAQYESGYYEKALYLCGEVIKDRCPEYMTAYQLSVNSEMITGYNMMIARKEVFDEYCEWLFDILFEVEIRMDIDGYDKPKAGVFVYLSDRLFRVWLMNNSFALRGSDAVRVESVEEVDTSIKNKLLYRYFSLEHDRLIKEYSAGNCPDIADNLPIYTDFEGRMPVWICWWQGLDSAPDIIKMCIDSVDRNLDKEKAKIHIITLDNVAEYVTFPDWIWDKFNRGLISYTHMSEILRVGLLYRYGGMWIDATYYIARPFDSSFYEKDKFHVIKLDKSIYKQISETNIVDKIAACCDNFLISPAGNVLYGFILSCYYEYWKTHNYLIDYYIIDYLMALAYNTIPSVKEEIDGCECSNPQLYSLAKVLGVSYNEDILNELCEDTSVFKLTYKMHFNRCVIPHRETFFGHLLEECESKK